MDYNIYIHDKTNGSQKPTKARKGGGTNTTAKTETSSGSSFGESIATLKNIKNGIKSMPTAGKLGIAIAVVKKAAEITARVIDTVEPFVTRETGDYRFNVEWSNTKALWNTVTHPFGSAHSYLTTMQKIRIANKRIAQERLLVGDAEVNSWERRL